MPKYKVGDHLLARLSGGRIMDASVKAVVEMTRRRVRRSSVIFSDAFFSIQHAPLSIE
jgi:hypothetical protein